MNRLCTKEQITEFAKVWYNDKTKRNAERVIIAMDPLVKYFVGKKQTVIKNSRIEFDDLMQEARMGVYRALEKYDGESCFTNYAPYWVQARITRHIENEMTMIKFCKNVKSKGVASKHATLYWKVRSENPKASPDEIHEQIAVELDVDVKWVILASETRRGMLDIDGPAKKNESHGKKHVTFGDTLSDSKNWESDFISEMDKNKAREILHFETETMKTIKREVARRFLLSDRETTLEEVGQHLGRTRERVRQVSNQARDELIFWARKGLGITGSEI